VEHAGIGVDELMDMIEEQLANEGTWRVRDVAEDVSEERSCAMYRKTLQSDACWLSSDIPAILKETREPDFEDMCRV